jgi:hypothetical protein
MENNREKSLTAETSQKLLQRFKQNTIHCMKNIFFGLIAIVFFSLSSFTILDTKDLILHTCKYKCYNASGQYLGTVTIQMWDFADCGSIYAQSVAIQAANSGHLVK